MLSLAHVFGLFNTVMFVLKMWRAYVGLAVFPREIEVACDTSGTAAVSGYLQSRKTARLATTTGGENERILKSGIDAGVQKTGAVFFLGIAVAVATGLIFQNPLVPVRRG